MFPRSSLSCALLPLMLASAMAQTSLPSPGSLPSQPSLPDPLVTRSGEKITSAAQWREKQAPELKELFQNYEYGFLPAAAGKVDAKVEREDKAAFGGKATLKEITLTWGMPQAAIHLLLVTPNGKGPAPVFLGLNFTGNHTVINDPQVRLPDAWMSKGPDHRASEEERGKNADVWCIEENIDRGYAVATFFNGDVVPDEPKLAEEWLRKFRGPNAEERGPSDAGTIALWAWCLMRGVDYLQTDAAIDAKRIALVGHSRNGKTALLAGALDPRVAVVIPVQAGCGGTAPSRLAPELATPGPNGRSVAETVKRINTSFPHWFSNNFKAFNDAVDRLPFDQHELIALCAPRPVLVTCATEDLWANPAGQFEMLHAADPVYRLVAGDGLTATKMPETGELVADRLGYFIRPGKHSMAKVDWEAFWKYADKWMVGGR